MAPEPMDVELELQPEPGTKPKRVSTTIARSARRAAQWFQGPRPHKTYAITPLAERWQTLPLRLLARLPQWARMAVYGAACIVWIVGFGVVVADAQDDSDIGGLGPPVRLSCVDTLWPSPMTCGLNGRNCFPFSNASFAFSCPAGCTTAHVLNPRAIGPHVVNYRSLVVGGAPNATNSDSFVYRADSFICAAAIHAGVVSNTNGGCGLLSLTGHHSNFGAVRRNAITSIAFDSHFPMSFVFDPTPARCRDPRWNLLILSTICTAVFVLCTTSPATFFPPIFTILFFQTAMASDPPSYSSYASLASMTLGRFLPAALAAALFYRFSVGISLGNCKAQVEKTVLWVGAAWVGALGNYTFDQIPIQRLTGHDIRQQPGAITALVIIVIALFAIVLYQAWCFRNQGQLPRLLALYIILGMALGILAAMPHLTLRIHHYIIALLLLPGTALQTRISLLCQGLLVGLFVNGVARWGFDPILQTAAALRGDAQLGTALPSILEPVINSSTITFTWDTLLQGYQGVSLLVNDVERYRGSDGSTRASYTWQRTQPVVHEYFRFGFVRHQLFGAVSYSDFTRAGTWFANGTWSGIPLGRT